MAEQKPLAPTPTWHEDYGPNKALTSLALRMLFDVPGHLVEDARARSQDNSSVIGELLALKYGVPRWAAEQAVREALAMIEDDEEEGDE